MRIHHKRGRAYHYFKKLNKPLLKLGKQNTLSIVRKKLKGK